MRANIDVIVSITAGVDLPDKCAACGVERLVVDAVELAPVVVTYNDELDDIRDIGVSGSSEYVVDLQCNHCAETLMSKELLAKIAAFRAKARDAMESLRVELDIP